MRKILAALGAVAVLVGGGVLLSNSANAAPENPALAGKRVLCVASDGSFRALNAPCSATLNADRKTPLWYAGPLPVPGAAGYADSVKAIVGAGGGVGPAGPQGPKGEPGDSIAKVVAKTLVLNVNSPATQTLVLTGLPASSTAVVELPVTNAGESPAGTVVTASPVVPAKGSTERSFIVKSKGFTGAQTFTLSVKVLSVSA